MTVHSRLTHVESVEQVTREVVSLNAKHRRPGFKRPIWEAKSGRDVSYSGWLVEVKQTVDREGNRYAKRVVQVVTGEVWKDQTIPLSQKR
jgi:hypothetical protein